MKAKKFFVLGLCSIIVAGCMSLVAFAVGGGVYYLYPEYNKTDGTFYENCSSGIKEWHEDLCEGYYQVTTDDTTWGETGETRWYVAMGQISIANTVTIQGDVRLILCDGAELTITGSTGAGIDNYGEGNSLTVYAESESSVPGILTVTGAVSCAGIRSAGGATVTINGGDVAAYEGPTSENKYAGACIGGNSDEVGSNITVNGGKVTADNAGNFSIAAGIGGGVNGNGEYITVNGGTVIAGNEKYTGAGIGGGSATEGYSKQGYGQGNYITVNGGDVTAKSDAGAGIGSGYGRQSCSYITITGGTVTAEGSTGIGGTLTAHDIIISGGTVTATGLGAAGIGGSGTRISKYQAAEDCFILNGNAWNITISGSDTVVRATTNDGYSAAIGGGEHGYGNNIVIQDGATVIAKSKNEGAAIGGGGRNMESYDDENPDIEVPYSQYTKIGDGSSNGDAEGIVISGEGTTVIAIGGVYSAGIGSGQYGNASNITVTEGAKVYATTTNGSAIGAGYSGGSADGITISDGAEVVAVASGVTAAIGARYNASNITIDNATVTVKSGDEGTAIGSAKGEATNITIKGEDTVVTAVSGDAEGNGAKGKGSAIGAGKDGSATGIYVDASLLMVQNNDETLTDDMEICQNRTTTEDVSSTVCNKDKCVIVIKPRDAYVAQVGTGDNAEKYYFVQTVIDKAIDKIMEEYSIEEYSINENEISFDIDENASANFEVDQCVEFDNITITMIADASEEINIPSIKVGIYVDGMCSSWFGEYAYFCQNITLDLNGHVLSAFFDSGESAVTIGKKQPLALIDSNPTAEHPFTVDDNGLYCWDEDFNSQVSSRLKTDEDGNYYWDDEATIVTIKGGCITGTARGQFDSASTLRTIAGVCNNAGTFNMYAGTITGNSGDIGGGVYNEKGSTMTVSGKAVIEGNTVNGTSTAQNVYLTSGTKITIDNLTEGANIGVTTETKPTAGNPVEFTTNGTKTDEAYFFSDDLDYADAYYNEGSLLNLVLGYRVTAKTAEGGTVSVGNQKSAYDGETINVTVTPDEGYELDTLAFSGEGIIATDITDKKSFTMPAKEVVVTGTFKEAEQQPEDNSTYLDLESNSSHEIEQKYTFMQSGDTTYVDVTKVKIEWTITDIAATYKSHRTWDPDTLAWVEAKEDIAAADKTATFNVTNYSSKSVKANVAFTAEEALKDTFDATNSSYTNNDCTVATPVVQDATTTYTEADFTGKAQAITATLKFKADAFKSLSAQDTAAKYGTFTLTLSDADAA